MENLTSYQFATLSDISNLSFLFNLVCTPCTLNFKSDNINTPSTFITKAQECLSEIGFKKCRFVEAGSLLMTCIAGSINCIGNVAVTDRRVAFNQQINAIVPKQDKVLYLYWLMLLSKPAIHSTINMALKGILSKRQLAEMAFPFPPIVLQEQFAAFVKQTNKSKLHNKSHKRYGYERTI